jgi:hypothetical protein
MSKGLKDQQGDGVGSWKKEKYISAKEQELLQPLDRT